MGMDDRMILDSREGYNNNNQGHLGRVLLYQGHLGRVLLCQGELRMLLQPNTA